MLSGALTSAWSRTERIPASTSANFTGVFIEFTLFLGTGFGLIFGGLWEGSWLRIEWYSGRDECFRFCACINFFSFSIFLISCLGDFWTDFVFSFTFLIFLAVILCF